MFRCFTSVTLPRKVICIDEGKLVFTMVTICIVFILTTLPHGICLVLFSFSRYIGSVILSDNFLVLLMKRMWVLNHCVNFLLYCLTGSFFRQTLGCLLKCHKSPESSRKKQTCCASVQETVLWMIHIVWHMCLHE